MKGRRRSPERVVRKLRATDGLLAAGCLGCQRHTVDGRTELSPEYLAAWDAAGDLQAAE